jgi:cell division transport system permease protein
MLLSKMKRILRSGFVSFWRNSFVSLASALIMTVTLSVIGILVFANAVLNTSLVSLRDKVDINIYFVTGADEGSILSLKKDVEALPEVASVQYVSRDQALADFKTRHENDQLTLQALDELGDNPLGAMLNIKAKETSQYESIAKFLESKNALSKGGTQIIDKVNYYQNKTAIDKLSAITSSARSLGLALVFVFSFISIMITFNTIRLVIYNSRDEISVMRLVGASTRYIRGPFVVSGIMYGVIAGVLTLLLFYPFLLWLNPKLLSFFSGFSLLSYYGHNFIQIFVIIVGTGIILGAISSYMAVRRYLKI